MVAVVVVLAATVSVVVLSVGEGLLDPSPSVTFQTAQDGQQVVLTHMSGEDLSPSNLVVTGAGGWTISAEKLRAGDQLVVEPAADAREIRVVWEGDRNTATLTTVDLSAFEIGNLLANPSFERGTGLNATDWEQATTYGTVEDAVERSTARSLQGEHSMKQVDINAGYSREFKSTEGVSVTPGKTYEFGGSYYLEGTTDTPSEYRYSLRIVWLDAEGDEIDQEPFFGETFAAFGEWTDVRLTAEAPANATTAHLRVRSKYEGSESTTVYWDAMFLEQAES
jgi:hypothetical protein